MTTRTPEDSTKTRKFNLDRQRRVRAHVPEMTHFISKELPSGAEAAKMRRVSALPPEWIAIVAAMQTRVAEGVQEIVREVPDRPSTLVEDRAAFWASEMTRVHDFVEYLLLTIRNELELDEGHVPECMVLVQAALLWMERKLSDLGYHDRDEEGWATSYRVRQALKALDPRLDGLSLRRFRALQIAEIAARDTHLPDVLEVESRIADISNDTDRETEDDARDFMSAGIPAFNGVWTCMRLSELDERFVQLDPVEVLEEFANARTVDASDTVAGNDEADGVGPVRTLARLAVTCGALGFAQNEGEDFDTSVERARCNLLVTRSRIKKAMGSYGDELAKEGIP